jgi:hypothetical protein
MRLLLAFSLALLPAAAQDVKAPTAPKLAPEDVEFFEKKIRPVLVDSCYSCHSAEAKSVKGSFRLDTKELLLRGGDTGPAIVPGDPDKSLLIKAIRHADKDLAMPPKKKLAAEVVADFEVWVKRGAPDPRVPAAAAKPAANHWAFKAPAEPTLPTVKRAAWAKNPIDLFILAKLEAKGLAPAPEADRRTLIRRLSFDLAGLPPKPEEVEAFVADKSPDAVEKLVDRLLASPAYGERWGRHWLDVARYADTKGYVFQEERRYPFAYTYRDWVVRALNEDMPYDRFIVNQIAADRVVAGDDKRDLAAMGFLTVGRRFLNNQNDIIDDRIDVVTRGLMGLTVSCARCHDHKFDPISIRDYYSLHGVFASSQEPKDLPAIGGGEKTQATLDFDKETERLKGEIEKFRRNRHQEKLKDLRTAKSVSAHLLAAREATSSEEDSLRELARKRDLTAFVIGRWVEAVKKDPALAAWKAYAAIADKDFAEQAKSVPLAAPFKAAPATAKEAADLFAAHLEKSDWLQAATSPSSVAYEDYDKLINRKDRDEQRAKERALEAHKANHPGAAAHAMVMTDRDKPATARVFIRGNANNPGPEVPRRFLPVLAGEDAPPFKDGSGRLELAKAIASKDNPLTARVMVNRVWAQHFGRPLVGTPSDFGVRSDAPSHPELLDWLALRFVGEDGWSLKKLHRRIVLSAAYRQSSAAEAKSEQADPENALFARQNRRRLEFEAMRDAILAVSGQLDLALGGRAEPMSSNPTVKQRQEAETIRNEGGGDPSQENYSKRRSIYLFVDRQNLPGTMRAFDFASPDQHSPARFSTTVPQQALFLMNGGFSRVMSEQLARRADVAGEIDPAKRVVLLYRLLYGREPSAHEVAAGVRFTDEFEKRAPVLAGTPEWQYGYGAWDEKSKSVKFARLPHFTGMTWQGGPALPDGKLGWLLVSAEGGHPGAPSQGGSIRRWTAPRDAVVSIEGVLGHKQAEGDGVVARIVSSRHGQLASWSAHNTDAETKMSRVEVKKGDTIDFLVECRGNEGWDSYAWAPLIRTAEEAAATGGAAPLEWSARAQFGGTAGKSARKTPTAWERYAHVLLQTNEFMFVD